MQNNNYSVYQHWDPLKTCVVGKAYPPKFFDWIKDSATRRLFWQLAEETEEDFQLLVTKLQQFGVEILRPTILPREQLKLNESYVPPPVTPRDYFLMIHDQLWIPQIPNRSHANRVFAQQKLNRAEFDVYDMTKHTTKLLSYQEIFNHVQAQGNTLQPTELDVISGCFVSRIGKNLYFATQDYTEDQPALLATVDACFPTTKNKIVNAGGHGDATYCPVAPGLIISLQDVPTYAETFPEWEVVYLPPSNYANMNEFKHSMKINGGSWFVPGFENNSNMVNLVEYYFHDWVGQVAETVFDVNILVVDRQNIIVSSHNNQVENACAKHGITVHVVPFRHRYFWDAGTHCITNDLNRFGTLQNWFTK
tara:strand:- start:48 stop:1139 length:1092 start_codon:yes stop_codon:yes gene_type:complete